MNLGFTVSWWMFDIKFCFLILFCRILDLKCTFCVMVSTVFVLEGRRSNSEEKLKKEDLLCLRDSARADL